MRMQFPTAGLAPALLLTAGLFAHAEPKTCAKVEPSRTEAVRLVMQVYPVADLVVPIPQSVRVHLGKGECRPEKAPLCPRTQEQELIKKITATVAPGSWASQGGRGTIDYYPQTMSLVVNQTAGVHEKVAEVLTALRRKQDVQVVVETRFVALAKDTWKKTGLAQGQPVGKEGTVRLFEVVQSDPRSNVMQAPKMTLFDGQQAELKVADAGPVGGKCEVSVRPVVSKDRRYVRLTMHLRQSDGTPIPTKKVCCEQAQPIPRQAERAVRVMAVVADGRTLVFPLGERVRREQAVPVPFLSKVPYVGRVFTPVHPGRQAEVILVTVTPRIIVQEEEEVRKEEFVCPYMREHAAKVRACRSDEELGKFEENLDRIERMQSAARIEKSIQKTVEVMNALHAGEEACEEEVAPCQDVAALHKHGRAAKLVREYRRACAEGRLAEATSLAVQALALDPTCFSKK